MIQFKVAWQKLGPVLAMEVGTLINPGVPANYEGLHYERAHGEVTPKLHLWGDVGVGGFGKELGCEDLAMEIDDPKIIALREKVTAAQEEFDMAVMFHEVWKPAAYDKDLHSRMGESYASQAFLITRTALRREMVLASIRLWDTNKQAIRMQSVAATLREKEVINSLAAARVKGLGLPEAIDQMRADLGKRAAEVILLINKYMEGGSHDAVLKKLSALRHERLAHRQLAPATATGANATDLEIEEFYQDNSKLIHVLLSLVNAMAYDPEDTAKVYRHYASYFWAGARGEQTGGHPNRRPRPPTG